MSKDHPFPGRLSATEAQVFNPSRYRKRLCNGGATHRSRCLRIVFIHILGELLPIEWVRKEAVDAKPWPLTWDILDILYYFPVWRWKLRCTSTKAVSPGGCRGRCTEEKLVVTNASPWNWLIVSALLSSLGLVESWTHTQPEDLRLATAR